jgi:hypothetical protein
MMKNKNSKILRGSKAALSIAIGVHVLLLLVAAVYVAVEVVYKEDAEFVAKKIVRPKMKLQKLKVPVKIEHKARKQAPKLSHRITAPPKIKTKSVEFKMPEVTGFSQVPGTSLSGGGQGGSLGFTTPEIDFFGAKARGDKVVFIVHFGPATIGKNPYQRMTGYTLRKRLEDMVNNLPDVALFNIAAYWMNDTVAFEPQMMPASPENKRKVKDWMKPVNPLQGNYEHCFVWGGAQGKVSSARGNYPRKVTGLPSYSMAWGYPYEAPGGINSKYLGANKQYVHWNRAVTWAIQTQKPNAIFILTTNYIDAWGGGDKGNPDQIAESYTQMIRDVYGPDKITWPSLNVVVLQQGNSDTGQILRSQFGPIVKAFNGSGSTIDNISKYMNSSERDMYREFESKYGAPVVNTGKKKKNR